MEDPDDDDIRPADPKVDCRAAREADCPQTGCGIVASRRVPRSGKVPRAMHAASIRSMCSPAMVGPDAAAMYR
jgi:hypothetical protein